MAGVGMYGVSQMKIDYNSIWYMRQNSYQVHFYEGINEFYPDNGERVQVYIGDIDYWTHHDEMIRVQEAMDESLYIRNGSIQFWYPIFYQDFCEVAKETGETNGGDDDLFGGDDNFLADFGSFDDSSNLNCSEGI